MWHKELNDWLHHDKSLIISTFPKKKKKKIKESNQEALSMHFISKDRIPSKCLLFLPISKNLIILKRQRSTTTEDIQKNLP